MKHTKTITILHSNDLHGDFLAEQVDENKNLSEDLSDEVAKFEKV